jgi:hypothetical protein
LDASYGVGADSQELADLLVSTSRRSAWSFLGWCPKGPSSILRVYKTRQRDVR